MEDSLEMSDRIKDLVSYFSQQISTKAFKQAHYLEKKSFYLLFSRSNLQKKINQLNQQILSTSPYPL